MIIRTMLIASEGHMLTDGTTYGKVIIPAETDDMTAYREITMEAYYELFPDERPVEVEEDATDVVGDSEPLPEEEIPEAIS